MIKRVDRGRSHYYVDTNTELRIPGVTSFTDKGLPKAALINWAAGVTVDYAIDNWDLLSTLPISERIRRMGRARFEAKDTAANKGTDVHKLADRLVRGEQVLIPEGLEGHVESYCKFLDEFDVQPVLVETTVYNSRHGYCGTFDLIADLLDPFDFDPVERRRQRWLLDIKTNRTGIYGETALQMAPYRYAPSVVDELTGELEPMPEVDLCGAVWVRADGYDLLPLEVGERQFREFLYVKQVAEFLEGARELVGEPILSPTLSPFHLEKE